jgi:hypothetical protein
LPIISITTTAITTTVVLYTKFNRGCIFPR